MKTEKQMKEKKHVSGSQKGGQTTEKLKKRIADHKLMAVVAIIIIIGIIYLLGTLYFRNHFLPRTVINGVACGGKNIETSTERFAQAAKEYQLTLKERDDKEETISGSDIDLEVDPGEQLEQLMESQNSFAWVANIFKKNENSAETAVTYDSEKLRQVLESLECVSGAEIRDSQNASLSDYQDGVGYELTDAVYGNRLDENVFYEKVDEAVNMMASELELDGSGCYVDPVYTADSREAKEMLEKANRYVNTTITYQFGKKEEVLDGSVISQWIRTGDDCSVSLDSEKEKEYVSQLADKYDTKWKSRTLVTHSGKTVTVPAGGNYGWRVNQDETIAKLNEYLEAGEDYTGEVVYYQRAAQYEEPDYGDTYVEVSISEQHFWYYQNAKVVLESDFVSGDPTKGRDTPKGAYQLAYKARDQVLQGEGYSSPVDYWMPFVDGVGFHDASWRDRFGGSIYKGDGSHGCLNLPPSVAKQLYDKIEAGIAILVY